MKQRVAYIDALRGFTMILVVYSHVLTFTCGIHPAFSFNDIFVTFRMPLFFFLSGFLMYKPGRFLRGGAVADFLKGKGKVQLLPTLIFTVAFCLIFRQSYPELWMDKAKCGYWFTITLFWFFLIYAVGDWLLGKCLRGRGKVLAGAVIAALVYAFSKYSLSPGCPWTHSFLCGFIGYANFQFFIFFFFGAFIRSRFEDFQQWLDGRWSALGVVVGFVILQFVLQLPQSRTWIVSTLSWSAYSLLRSFSGFFGIVVVLAFFRKYRDFFESTRVGKSLQSIGSRTLDIYLIHLLLIRTDLRYIGSFFARHESPVAELLIVTALSLFIIAICLLISRILRCSDTLAKLLFGKV